MKILGTRQCRHRYCSHCRGFCQVSTIAAGNKGRLVATEVRENLYHSGTFDGVGFPDFLVSIIKGFVSDNERNPKILIPCLSSLQTKSDKTALLGKMRNTEVTGNGQLCILYTFFLKLSLIFYLNSSLNQINVYVRVFIALYRFIVI